ncbi:MAG: C39 family peptidase [Oscillospiraceae bacterium]|nr:C39 family peptidase [Oscillospiraceae bacterium]
MRRRRTRTRRRILPRLLFVAVVIAVVLLARAAYRSPQVNEWLTHGESTVSAGTMHDLRAYARKNGFDVSAYPDELIALYERNEDARQFVLDYPLKKDETPTVDLSDLAGSGSVPLLMQWDERWGYREYNSNIIGLAGCGPTCLSMVAIYLRGDTSMTPLWMCQYAEQHGYCVAGSGTTWSFMTDGARALGLDVTEIPMDEMRIRNNLEVGNPIVCIVGPGDFTTTGHFIVLTGLKDGKITVNDPNSVKNSQKLWTFDQLQGQVQGLWVMR